MNGLDTAETIDRLVEWLNRKLAPPGLRIGPETPLFGKGMIDSIRILELIAWTEREFGRRIPDRMIRMDHFRDARRIVETFCDEGLRVDR